jgi:antitoxin component YwqK of YwqJK toxin-antitoxin module
MNILISLLFSLSANAGPCEYNGKKLDSQPENFTGKKVCFDSKGAKDEEMEMKNGKRDGVFKRYHHKTGKLQNEWLYKDGEISGIQKDYDTDTGKLHYLKIREKAGPSQYLRYNPDGNLTDFSCGPTPLPGDAKICGRSGEGEPTMLYHSEKGGGVHKVVRYKNLKPHGDHIRYERDGKTIAVKETFKDGETVYYEEFSSPKRLRQTKKGDLMESITHFPSGKMKEKLMLKDNKPVSEEHYFENGKLDRKVDYGADGLVKEESFSDLGEPACKETYRLSYGRKARVGEYSCTQAGSRFGAFKENYVDGERHGEQLFYHASGAVAAKQIFEKGVLKTGWKFDEAGNTLEHFDYEPDGSRKPPAKK